MVDPRTLRLSPHFTLAEFIASPTALARGIDNSMPAVLLPAATALCVNVFEPLRAHFGGPLILNSGYRCPALNLAVGSTEASQHGKAEAGDVERPGVSNYDLACYIRDHLPFDQLILENYRRGVPDSGWVHVSFRPDRLRRSILTKLVGERGYRQGLIQ
jgi:zinc D-Ala-D-Ala carboxypeptidase